MKRTPLYDVHAQLGATFTPFAGYEMPVHYGSIKAEHMAVRDAVGLFDVSHMSNLWVTGDKAASTVLPRSIEDLPEGRGRYSLVLNDDGTILDDIFFFRTQAKVFAVPNAGMNEAVASRLQAAGADVEDVSDAWAILALQGPNASDVLEALGQSHPGFHRIHSTQIAGQECLVSGTGYTGEKGVEIYVASDGAATVWQAIMDAGSGFGIKAIGLGARDSLRLEKGYCLAGNEFAGGRTPSEANLGFVVDKNHVFPGRDRFGQPGPRLWGLVQERGMPRHGYDVCRDGQVIGTVTSGGLSPCLGKGIALAYLSGVEEGQTVDVMVRDRPMKATVTKPPFW